MLGVVGGSNGCRVSDLDADVVKWEGGFRGDNGVVLVDDVLMHGELRDER